jgi:hypothetical protein
MGTLRMCPPLPIRSTTTQCPWRIWISPIGDNGSSPDLHPGAQAENQCAWKSGRLVRRNGSNPIQKATSCRQCALGKSPRVTTRSSFSGTLSASNSAGMLLSDLAFSTPVVGMTCCAVIRPVVPAALQHFRSRRHWVCEILDPRGNRPTS